MSFLLLSPLQNLKVHLAIYATVFGIAIIIALSSNQDDKRLPCQYLDSINITGGIRRADDSIEFNGMVFGQEQYARIDYVLENGVTHKIVEPYVRGCICQMKSCVRLCCPYGWFYQNRTCHRNSNERVPRLETAVLDEQKQTKSIILDHHFAYVNDRSCHQRYIADEYQMIYVRIRFVCCFFHRCCQVYVWNRKDSLAFFTTSSTHFQTGSILFEGKHLSHWDYCLNPVPTDDDGDEQSDRLDLKALVCLDSEEPVAVAGKHMNNFLRISTSPAQTNRNCECANLFFFSLHQKLVGMMLSVPFIAVTALVYIMLTELNNFYGKCLVNHLLTLACGYIILGVIQLNGTYVANGEVIAGVVLFAFIASFVWVGVISVELYLSFR